MHSELLPILVLIPLAGAVVGALAHAKSARTWALLVSLATFIISLVVAVTFDFSAGGVQFLARGPAIAGTGFSLSLGVDSISLWLILLTTLLAPLAIAASFESIKERQKEYYAWMLLLLAAMVGVFVSRDLLLFYVFFELTLIPMFFIIGIWGGPDKRHAAGKFFLFTFTGSVFTLAAAVYLGVKYHTFDISDVMTLARYGGKLADGSLAAALSPTERKWVLWGFLAGFAVKVPLFPVHTWLPLAHTEAPTAGSVILAGVLLKLGTYGLLRLAVPVGIAYLANPGDPHSPLLFAGVVRFLGGLCVIGVIYGALVAWVQQDIKKLVAYSSVSHLGFCVLGLLALNSTGLQGSVLYMINHGLSTGAMFLCVGMVYDRYHTRDINMLSGLAKRMPILAFFWILFTLSSIGLPGLNGFVSEFLTILGAFTSPFLGIKIGTLAALGIILGAVYMLHMAARVIWGPLKTPALHEGAHGQPQSGQAAASGRGHGGAHGHGAPGHGAPGHGAHANAHGEPGDLNRREIAILVPLALAVVFLGVFPAPLMKSMEGPLDELREPVRIATDNAVESPAAAPVLAHKPAIAEPLAQVSAVKP